MSGIVAAIRTNGAPVDADLIRALTKSLAFRGPDAQATCCAGTAALGHALLRCGDPFSDIGQPLALDGDTWIVADARLDDRATLLRALDLPSSSVVSDAELILRAYRKWAAKCVDYLFGDFAFAIWTASSGQLFCARDHLGVKPLYYSRIGAWVLVSSAVECLRAHPQISRQLDELAVADFLLFGHKTDPAATTFRD